MTDYIHVRGFVATYPTLKHLPNGTAVVNFRLASTPRWFDSSTQQWCEGTTNWFTVNAFRQLAHNACRSLQIGHPVIIDGKLKIKTWEREDGTSGQSVDIDAQAIGHDLTLGTSNFQRNIQASSQHPESQHHGAEGAAQGQNTSAPVQVSPAEPQHSESANATENAGGSSPERHPIEQQFNQQLTVTPQTSSDASETADFTEQYETANA